MNLAVIDIQHVLLVNMRREGKQSAKKIFGNEKFYLYLELFLFVKEGRQYTYKSNNETPWHNHFCRGKAISIPYSECVSVALVI